MTWAALARVVDEPRDERVMLGWDRRWTWRCCSSMRVGSQAVWLVSWLSTVGGMSAVMSSRTALRGRMHVPSPGRGARDVVEARRAPVAHAMRRAGSALVGRCLVRGSVRASVRVTDTTTGAPKYPHGRWPRRMGGEPRCRDLYRDAPSRPRRPQCATYSQSASSSAARTVAWLPSARVNQPARGSRPSTSAMAWCRASASSGRQRSK
jgi:hypothetical protein